MRGSVLNSLVILTEAFFNKVNETSDEILFLHDSYPFSLSYSSHYIYGYLISISTGRYLVYFAGLMFVFKYSYVS